MTFETLECDECGKKLGLLDANDLEGSYFYCSEVCGEASRTKRAALRVKRDEYFRRREEAR